MRLAARAAITATLAAGAFSLGACSSSESEGDTAGEAASTEESAESVAAKIAAADITPRPGRWDVQMQMRKFDMPGMPDQMKGMMQQQMGKMRTSSTCLTPEEASRPKGDFFQPGSENCKYEHFSMDGGKIDAAMTCQEQGVAQNMRMRGTYSEEAYAITINADGEVEGQPMSMEMAINSKRVGDCTGDEDG
ncbi:hypothetical protein B2G71_02530 [Novosphingobium sp. PC22D]|uniref:DUF3617 domain-containing protein n=1 Tax=Novosphingobium sp. PC22D TaxID=1962403 RepID=UPI000BEF4895|nr:DUF3617 domain-containing protein [Novosphingobium sp. PC22D]PEQ14480.1 hypothetical protein B2G71_02530 [Novosphingobium sp. PC22D]